VTTEDTTMKALVVEAMYKALDDKKKEELIRAALAALVAPKQSGTYGYSQGKTEIHLAFEGAVLDLAREVVREMIATDEIRARMRELAAAAFEKMLTNRDALANEMASALVGAITKAGNY